jgi:hypothetical protein
MEMKRKILTAVFAALGLALMMAGGTAHAVSVNIGFPSSGTSFHSATNGDGTIPAGGQSEYMWTSGDYVSQTFSGVGLNSVGSLEINFTYQNFLGHWNTENVNILVNGISVSNFIAPDDVYHGDYVAIHQTANFPSIVGNGTYALSMVLQDTIPLRGGSIAFLDGGQCTLTDANAVPEPATRLLFSASLLGLVGLRGRLKK